MKTPGVAFKEAVDGNLYTYLIKHVPREEWNCTTQNGYNYLHFACVGDNVDAVKLLFKSGVSPDSETEGGIRSLIILLIEAHFRHEYHKKMLELFCAAGVSFHCEDIVGRNPLQISYAFPSLSKILIANGMRIDQKDIFKTPLELFTFQKAVLKCRTAVVAMLRVKRVAKLWNWDKFLLKEIGYAIWATRYDENWEEK
jgi:hypothetical protein